MDYIDLGLKASGLLCLVLSAVTSGHISTKFMLIAILNAGLSGMFA